jgi:hypothetical protein
VKDISAWEEKKLNWLKLKCQVYMALRRNTKQRQPLAELLWLFTHDNSDCGFN